MSDSKTALPNARAIDTSATSAGQPSEAQLQAASDNGVRTVVNLRPAGEFKDYDEAALAADLGLRYVHIPVAGPEDLTTENAEHLHRALAREDDRPVIVHCGSGNRVGALVAYRERHILGRDKETAVQKGLDAGLNPDSPLYEATRKALD